ncbi:AMP-dependent synthetase [Frankia sp. R43]|nr:AMP-dependent synthetase [Frankia sp. R43]
MSAATLWQLVQRRADAAPDAPLLLDDLGRTLTAAGLRDAAAATAAGLLGLGVGHDSVVSWQLPTSLEAVVLAVACARLGVSQNPIVPTLREREVSYIVEQVGTTLLAVPPAWRGFDHQVMATAIAAARGFRILVVDHRAAAAAGELGLPTGSGPLPPPPPPTVDAEQEIRWIYYTSGTTAAPKGVLHTDASVMAAAAGSVTAMRLGPDDVYPIAFPIAHIGGTVMLAAALASGTRLLLVDAFDPATSPLTMAAHGATILGSATPFLRAYLAAQAGQHHGDQHRGSGDADAAAAAAAAALFPRLRVAVSGGAAKPAGLHREIADALGGRGLVSSWGMTEFPLATHGALDDTDDDLDRTEGRPTPGVEVRVVGPDGRDCPAGVEGELLVRGPQLFAGYLAAADADAGRRRPIGERRSRPAELFDPDGFFRTGDVGVAGPRGHVRISGRRKDIVIRNAENISASEVEEVIATHPAVGEVAVIGLPDPRTGERCCAVITLVPGAAPVGLTDLARHCEDAGLARYKIPEQVEIVDVLPRTDMGKIAKSVLRNRFQP